MLLRQRRLRVERVARRSAGTLVDVFVALLQRDCLETVRRRVEHEQIVMHQTLRKTELFVAGNDVIPRDIDSLLQILRRRLEELGAVAIAAEEQAATETAAFDIVRCRPKEH